MLSEIDAKGGGALKTHGPAQERPSHTAFDADEGMDVSSAEIVPAKRSPPATDLEESPRHAKRVKPSTSFPHGGVRQSRRQAGMGSENVAVSREGAADEEAQELDDEKEERKGAKKKLVHVGDDTGRLDNPTSFRPSTQKPAREYRHDWFEGAVIPSSPDKSPAYVEDLEKGIRVTIWTREAQAMSEAISIPPSRPYAPHRRCRPRPPYQVTGSGFPPDLVQRMSEWERRRGPEKEVSAKLGKIQPVEEDGRADAV